MPSRFENTNSVAIVGASSLLGKELKQVLEDRNFPTSEITLLDESVMAGTLTEAAGEPTFIRALDQDSFDGIRFAFFAGTVSDAERNWLAAQRAGATVIDLTGAVRASGLASVSIPSLAHALPPRSAPSANGSAHPMPYSSPKAAVIIACTLAAGLRKFGPQRIVAVLFPPVSDCDQVGVEELERQTTNLLSFQPIEKHVFDAQVAFNLLSAYGGSGKLSLAEVRSGIIRDVGDFLGGRAPVPVIQLIQAPVFYGYAFSAYAELSLPAPTGAIKSAFTDLGARFDETDDAPSTVSVAGESEIHFAQIESDPVSASGFWFWGVADNLRIAATNAVRIAEQLIAQSGGPGSVGQ